jgi:phage baseplate assembly protein V
MSAAIWRRVWNSLGFGTLTAINDAGTVQTVQLKLNTGEMRDGTPVVQLFGLSANPPAGTNAVAHFLGGDRSNAVVVGTNHQPSRPVNQKSGETTLYNNFSMTIALTQAGIIINGGGQPLIVENAPTVTINAPTAIIANTPIFKCSGDIQDNYTTNTKTMAQMRSLYDQHDHQVVNVSTGTSTITTTTPSPQE